MGFLSQWKMYLDELPKDPNQSFTGRRLDPTVLEKVRNSCVEVAVGPGKLRCRVAQMSAEQIGQLYELMHATKDVWKPVQPYPEDESGSNPQDSS